MSSQNLPSIINWHAIHTVFLDMDGTLLDLHYDNQFWQEYLPQRYAKKNNLPIEAAKEFLFSRYTKMLGTLEWYSVDYWTTELDLEVTKLGEELAHLIVVRFSVIELLNFLHQQHKKVLLVTNAHHKSLSLKMQRTQLAHHFDRIICAHDLGLPKESLDFWSQLQTVEPFEPTQTLLIDDSVPALRSAAHYGIHYLLGIHQPDSHLPPTKNEEFLTIQDFREIM